MKTTTTHARKMIRMTLLAALLSPVNLSCDKIHCDNCAVGEGFEIYLTVIPYADNHALDYGKVDFDTILLEAKPILRYNDLLKYNTLTHKLTLGISHDALHIGDAGVYGRMFVVTVDSKPIYCGFKWPVFSSVPCNWVFIEEPYAGLHNLKDNEIVISFVSTQYDDPRSDKRIVDRLRADGKIENSLAGLLDFNNRTQTDIDRIEYFVSLNKKEFSRKDYMNIFKDISSATASRDIKKGVDLNYFERTGEKNQTSYKISGAQNK